MEEQTQEREISLKTPKQEELIAKLIQSSWFTKAERDFIVDKISGKLITTKDAGILIAYMIEKIRFQGHFNGKRKHKIAECYSCKNKINLERYEDVRTGDRQWLCEFCRTDADSDNCIPVSQSKNNEN